MTVPAEIRAVLDSLAEDALVLDVGGWAQTDPRATHVIDLGSWKTRDYYFQHLGGETHPESRVTAETWVQHDICSSEAWPFADDMFDYVICSHTLEDVRDPIRACEEIARVGRAGYLETPGAATEVTRGIESALWCGWHHHRWLVEASGNELTFLQKPHHIHSPYWPAVPSPRLLSDAARQPTALEWSGSLEAREEVIVDFEEFDARLRSVALRATRGGHGRLTLQRWRLAGWQQYRRGRGALMAAGRRARH